MRDFVIGMFQGWYKIGEFTWSHFRGLFVGSTRLARPVECSPGQVLVRGLRCYVIVRILLSEGAAVIAVRPPRKAKFTARDLRLFTVKKGQQVEVQCD